MNITLLFHGYIIIGLIIAIASYLWSGREGIEDLMEETDDFDGMSENQVIALIMLLVICFWPIAIWALIDFDEE